MGDQPIVPGKKASSVFPHIPLPDGDDGRILKGKVVTMLLGKNSRYAVTLATHQKIGRDAVRTSLRITAMTENSG